MAKDMPGAAPAPTARQMVQAPMGLRAAMRKYAIGGDVVLGRQTEDDSQLNFSAEEIRPETGYSAPQNQTGVFGLENLAGGAAAQNQASPSNVLSGNILAGASWNSINPTLASQLTEATGIPTSDYSVGATTSADTLKQLNDFTSAGGSFEPGATVFLQAGGADFLRGVPREDTESNLDSIISELERQGVNVVLTGSPNASSYEDVIENRFDPSLDPIYGNVAGRHGNVSLVDSMGSILQDKSLLSDAIHPNEKGWEIYNQSVLDALRRFKG